MAQENDESRPKTGKRRRVNLPWPVAQKSEVVKVAYETRGEGKETADGDEGVLVKPRVTSGEVDASRVTPPIAAPAPTDPDSVVS